MMKNQQGKSGNAWAWATVAIVFIVFYFNKETRNSDEERGRSERSVSGQRLQVTSSDSLERDRRERIANELRTKAARLQSEAASKLHAEAGEIPEQDARYRILAKSMDWLNRSMGTVGEKLRDVTTRIENHETEEEVEKAIKQALMDAFAETQTSGSNDPLSNTVSVENPSPTSDKEPIEGNLPTVGFASTEKEESTAGEIESSSSFAFTAGEDVPPGATPPIAEVPPLPPAPPAEKVAFSELSPSGSVSRVIIVSGDQPILGEGVPNWIRQPVTEAKRVVLPIESSMHSTLEECREDLDSKLVPEVKRMLDKYVLQRVSADEIPELTASFIRDKLVHREGEFDNYQERPSGNFHQLWVRMEADEKEIEQIRNWEREVVTQDRAKQLGGAAGAVLVSLALFSGAVGWLAKREQKRLKQPSVT